MNLAPVFNFLGRLISLVAGAMLLPFFWALGSSDFQAAGAFLISGVLTLSVGGTMVVVFGGRGGDLYRSEGILIVVGGWLLASLFGALPYLLTGSISHPVDALFESASGFTTTGSTILIDIESLGIRAAATASARPRPCAMSRRSPE